MPKVKTREDVESNGVLVEVVTYEDGSQKATVKGEAKKTSKPKKETKDS